MTIVFVRQGCFTEEKVALCISNCGCLQLENIGGKNPLFYKNFSTFYYRFSTSKKNRKGKMSTTVWSSKKGKCCGTGMCFRGAWNNLPIGQSLSPHSRLNGNVRHVFERRYRARSNESIADRLTRYSVIQKWRQNKSRQKETTKSSHVGIDRNVYSKSSAVALLIVGESLRRFIRWYAYRWRSTALPNRCSCGW